MHNVALGFYESKIRLGYMIALDTFLDSTRAMILSKTIFPEIDGSFSSYIVQESARLVRTVELFLRGIQLRRAICTECNICMKERMHEQLQS